jgi:hypothetical protein
MFHMREYFVVLNGLQQRKIKLFLIKFIQVKNKTFIIQYSPIGSRKQIFCGILKMISGKGN